MGERVQQIIGEVIQMRDQYFAEVGADARRTWPKSIRERIILLDSMKVSRKEIAESTGVPYDTIIQWRHYEKKRERRNFHTLEVKTAKPLKKETLRLPAVLAAAPPKPFVRDVTVTVTSPDGYRVEGPAAGVVKIVRALGRR